MDRASRFRWLGVIPPALAVWFTLSSTVLASGSSLLLLSSDPYTNTDSQHKTEVEPDTFASGSTFVSAFQVGRFFNGGASNIGFATFSDGGKKVTNGFLPYTTVNAMPAGIYPRASDASVAFDAKDGVWLISWLGIVSPSGPVDVRVSRSTDGVTWGKPVVVNASGHFNDKNWTVCDNNAGSPHYGNCYTEFDDNTLGDLEQMSTSTNGGLTWGVAKATRNNDHGIGGQPVVQPDGTVIVPYVAFSFVSFLIASFASTDGGGSWSAGRIVSPVKFRHPAGGIRSGIPLPSAEIDALGKVYVVWSDCRFEPGCSASDLVFSTTSDGNAWSPVTRIPLDPIGSGVDHFIPGLAVNNSTSGGAAQLALAFYFYPLANCTSTTCQLDVGSSTSRDGGATWTSNAQIAGPMTLSWLPNTTQGRMVGDYISTSFVNGPAFPAFAVATAPTSGGSDCATATPHCDEATFTLKEGLTVAVGGNIASDQLNLVNSGSLTSSTLTNQ
jgi:hypothetical protein